MLPPTPPMPRENQAIPPELHLRCCSCGYELTGLTVRRCPECGEEFEPLATWQANQQDTWTFHFEYVRSRGDYARVVLLVLLAGVAGVLTWLAPLGWFALVFVAVGELSILRIGGGRYTVRLIYLLAMIGWDLVNLLGTPF